MLEDPDALAVADIDARAEERDKEPPSNEDVAVACRLVEFHGAA